ncbi:HNH endonuclease signature motif containing protein [Naasia sp. SYSU D00057]|uniref:HNH endonuclease signature motif containing protein n=1 Tax=Naasia sp. SYSU D00057 TaxID=2817380 RepID=UPI001B305116|nr:HNH endonuclease signature motif containing protein [Naasia sp. SYSU D00057]
MEERTTTLLAEQADTLALRVDALAAGRPTALAETLMAASDGDLLDFHRNAVQVLRLAEAAVVSAAGEVARRSESGLPDSLARRYGEKSAAALLAQRSGQHEADAAAHARLGLALAQREGVTGDVLPPFFPRVTEALAAGLLSTRSARAMVQALEKIERSATTDDLGRAEKLLVDGAISHWSATTLLDVCRALPDRFDPDGAEPREAAVRARRGLLKRVLDDGTIQYLLNCDPEGSAYLDAALDARTAPRRRVRFEEDDESDGAIAPDATRWDDRSWPQKRLDALIDIARDSIRHDDGQIAGVDTTAVIHVPLEALTEGRGAAWFEGVETPVSARTAQRVMQCADIVAVLLDGDGQPIGLGPTRRFFSRAQRRAMAARDGGCVWPGCTAPPRWCDGAHVEPWRSSFRTDIGNGVLLCHFHHRRLDEDGWTLEIRDGVPWFTPPSHIDASRTPRRGGRSSAPRARPPGG